MIEKMTKYSFILLSGDKEVFLHNLEDLGLMDITRSVKPIDDNSAKMLERAEDISRAVAKLKSVDYSKDPDFQSIKQVKVVDVEDPVNRTFHEINLLNELQNSLSNAIREHSAIESWGSFDKSSINQLEEKGYIFRFYSVKEKVYDSNWEDQYAIQIISKDRDNINFVTISDDQNYSFPINDIPRPNISLQESEHRIDTLKTKIIESKSVIHNLVPLIGKMEEERHEKLHKLDMYLANEAAESKAENYISVFEGFAPTNKEDEVCQALDQMELYYIKDKASVQDNPPIHLKNNWFTRMFKGLTDMYGRPVYNEFDPTPYLSIFFLLFFAMCMGDAGYGLVLIIAGLFLKRKKDFATMAPLVITLGVGTFVVGVVMHTFFGVDIAELSFIPQWCKKIMITGTIAGFEAPMVVAILVGIVHLCLAIMVKTIYATKNRGFLNSLSVWGWTLLIVGGVIVGGLFAFKLLPIEVTKWIIIVLGIVSAIAIFLLNDLKRNPLINVGVGLWETYNTVTGLLGDVLSYLRLYALGLAGSMLGKAFNQIATMTLGDGGFGLKPQLILFAVIIILGHTLNIAMCCLGAFVHPLRLNFLEFFKNSGYEGKGRKYKPIRK